MLRPFILFFSIVSISWWLQFTEAFHFSFEPPADKTVKLRLQQDTAAGTIKVYRVDTKENILTQNALPDFRPYMHPIATPDGKGVLTEYSPGHHKHQTGLYWGFTRVNGRDYFHNPSGGYWKRIAVRMICLLYTSPSPRDS